MLLVYCVQITPLRLNAGRRIAPSDQAETNQCRAEKRQGGGFVDFIGRCITIRRKFRHSRSAGCAASRLGASESMDGSYVPGVVRCEHARCRRPRRAGIGQGKAD
jgi:hypothetical protein